MTVTLGKRNGVVQIYPNPTINKAVIAMTDRPDQVTFTLSTLAGQFLNLQPAQTDAGWELDMSGLSSGIYILRMEFDGKIVTKRLVKQ